MNDDPKIPNGNRRHLWPWFALAAVILGIVLAFLWMSVAVRKVRDSRAMWNSPALNVAQRIS